MNIDEKIKTRIKLISANKWNSIYSSGIDKDFLHGIILSNLKPTEHDLKRICRALDIDERQFELNDSKSDFKHDIAFADNHYGFCSFRFDTTYLVFPICYREAERIQRERSEQNIYFICNSMDNQILIVRRDSVLEMTVTTTDYNFSAMADQLPTADNEYPVPDEVWRILRGISDREDIPDGEWDEIVNGVDNKKTCEFFGMDWEELFKEVHQFEMADRGWFEKPVTYPNRIQDCLSKCDHVVVQYKNGRQCQRYADSYRLFSQFEELLEHKNSDLSFIDCGWNYDEPIYVSLNQIDCISLPRLRYLSARINSLALKANYENSHSSK